MDAQHGRDGSPEVGRIWMEMVSGGGFPGYSFRDADPPGVDTASMTRCLERCEDNVCGRYGTNWGCPPGNGGADACMSTLSGYRGAALIYRRSEMDPTDEDAVDKMGSEHQDACRRFAGILRRRGYAVLPLADGGCRYCGKCSFPSDPCRFPDQQVPSISGFGIEMSGYLESQGLGFAFEEDAVTLYGLILYNEP